MPTFDIDYDDARGKVLVVRYDNERRTVLAECDDRETAENERDGYEEGYHDECAAREAGDDPRYDPPDDPHAYQRELAELHRSQY